VAQARVAVRDAAGNHAEGGARLLGAATAVAVAAAVCDAVWAGNLPGRDQVAALAARGRAATALRDRRRAGGREATRVRFTELGETP
jgi:alpha-D-ribose 1-methylphosphonate 5-triphosphate synthase subunit PhnG